MMAVLTKIKSAFRCFRRNEDGVVTVEFVIIFPLFLTFFLMSYEFGMLAVRQVMMERAVDLAARDVRVGILLDPDQDALKDKVCEVALLIPDCQSQMKIEMRIRDLRAWTALTTGADCIDRAEQDQTPPGYALGVNNQLMVMRACVMFDPMIPMTVDRLTHGRDEFNMAGKALSRNGTDHYPLSASTAFVMEPFRK